MPEERETCEHIKELMDYLKDKEIRISSGYAVGLVDVWCRKCRTMYSLDLTMDIEVD